MELKKFLLVLLISLSFKTAFADPIGEWKIRAEEKRIIKMRDETERRYFDREIDEESYIRLMREHESKLIETRAKIDTLEARLKGIRKEKKR
jgi:hypothetical protein